MRRGSLPRAQGAGCGGSDASWCALLLALTLTLVPALLLCGSAVAQSSELPSLSVQPRIVAQAETPVLLQIVPNGAVPPKAFVNLRGLPPSIGLSDGHSIAPGAWAVPLNALPTLKAYVPSGLAGESVIAITLIGGDGRLLAVAKTTLVIGAPPSTASKSPSTSPKAEQAPLSVLPPGVSGQDLIDAEALLKRGVDALENGRVEIARQFYLRAVEKGLAAAAMRLGASYDPAELGRLKAQGVVPDIALARKWYERARQLGAPEAVERLARLGGS